MFFIAGITGHIGGATAKVLLAEGRPVRALVRNLSKAIEWADRGVELQAGDLTDSHALAEALEGVEAAFLMQPTPMGVTRNFPEAHALTHSIADALERTPPPRAVVLSSVGSEQDCGLGNITQTHLLERALDRFTFPLAFVRSGALLENNLQSLKRAGETGVFDSFLQPVDRAFPMAATADVGAEVARLLVEGWKGRKVIELGSYYSPTEIAEAMGKALMKPVQARAIPRDRWGTVLEHMGLPPEKAVNWEEMQDGFNNGWIDFGCQGTEAVAGTTKPVDIFGLSLQAQKA
ncbi:NmrA family NAD(P)-binding protein [Lichenicoccus sp.]|uniref:NmrA family NAD(P)-binding protein n=1 Tax=Lichenicoccus sp. TaxID=2781899 RepID=UPI003D0DB0BD